MKLNVVVMIVALFALTLGVISPAPVHAQGPLPCDYGEFVFFDNEPPTTRFDVWNQPIGQYDQAGNTLFPSNLFNLGGNTWRGTGGPASTTQWIYANTGFFVDAIQFDYTSTRFQLGHMVITAYSLFGQVLDQVIVTQPGTYSLYSPASGPGDFTKYIRRVVIEHPRNKFTDNLYAGLCVDPVVPVEFDVQPTQINCNSALFTSWIMGTADLDLETVDKESLMVNGVQESHWSKKEDLPKLHFDDVNADGFTDIVFHADTTGAIGICPLQDDIQPFEIGVGGMLADGTVFAGSETVNVKGNAGNQPPQEWD